MDYAEHVDALDREITSFAAAVGAAPPEAPVPTCPEFDLAGLTSHVGDLLAFWSHVLAEATGTAKPPIADAPDDDAERQAWLVDLGAPVVAALRAAGPDTPAWTWYPPNQTFGFWARRAAHELAVHRVDAQLAGGTATPIDAALARDGIDEALTFAALRWNGDAVAAPCTIHLHGTDLDDAEWLLRLDADGIVVEQVHAKGDLALRGSVSDLELALYARPAAGELQRFGDEAALTTFQHAFTF